MGKILPWAVACLLCGVAAATIALSATDETIALTATADDAPSVTVNGRSGRVLTLEFTLPSLAWSDLETAGGTVRALAIPGGGQVTGPGGVALPTFSRLVAVPGGTTLRARLRDAAVRELPGVRLVPALDPPVGDKAAVAGAGPSVSVGTPAILRDLVVVPVTFQPVACGTDGAGVTVAASMTVDLEFVPEPQAPAAPPRRPVTESFDRLYRDLVVNYEADSEPVRGGWLLICPNDATVLSTLQPLVDWRRRQGYTVAVVTTATTGTTTASIKAYLQDAYNTWKNPPLEFVALAGDADGSFPIPTWYESLTSYAGEGDHYYTTLAGSDILGDVHIGRLSFTSTAELGRIVTKIITYETNPPVAGVPDWFVRGSVTGDPSSSGMATIYISQWAKAQMLSLGYARVDTLFSGNYAAGMLTNLSAGGTLFTYRGYYGMSGFGTTQIAAATNGFRLPFAVIPTCDTGSFARNTTCRTEAFLRGNAAAAGGGGIGAVGTATIGTHTRYNDCMFHGILQGVLHGADHRLGPALSRGKLELWANYQNDTDFSACPTSGCAIEVWSVWNNLMGDPATEMWTGSPRALVVTAPASVAVGADAVSVSVHDGALPVAGARVALYKAGEIAVSALTDQAGTVNLPLGGGTAGAVLLTVTEHAHRPYLGSVALGSATSWVALASTALMDDGTGGSVGNGDGQPNPGETLALTPNFGNRGTTTATGISALLVAADAVLTVAQGATSCADLAPGATAVATAPLLVTVSPAAADGHLVRGDLAIASAQGSWTSLVQFAVKAPALAVTATAFGGPGGSADPGESGTLTVTLANSGSVALAGATATLRSDSPWVTVTDSGGTWGAIGLGSSGTNAGDTFAIAVAPDCYRGHLATFSLDLVCTGGASATAAFTLRVGTASGVDPVGPDHYGYYAFDNTDVAYPEAPTYSWVEVDPTLGGAGTSVGLTDFAEDQDDTKTVTLPFPFVYYGKTFSEVSICSNGWFAFGRTSLKLFRNFAIPSAGSPDNMVAVFWDNLNLDSAQGGVFGWYDAGNHRFVIEWSRCVNNAGGTENLEAILYDPAYHATDTGDGAIVCQYSTINNVDTTNGYASVGVQNADRSDGVLYTYWNVYAAAAATLQSGRAIRFVPVSPVDPGFLAGHVRNLTAGGAPVAGAQVLIVEKSRTLVTGPDGSFFGSVPPGTYTLVASHPSFAPDTLRTVAVTVAQTTQAEFSLRDVAGPAFASTTALPSTNDVVGPYVVETHVTDQSSITSLHFYYAASGVGGTHELPLTLVDAGSGLYRAEIPGQPIGSWVQYWLEGTDVGGNRSTEPAGAPWQNFSFGVGNVTVVFADDMESNRGWTVGSATDDATTGLWTRVDPNGLVDAGRQVQPEDDATPAPGVTCWITGNDPVGSTQGTDDVDGGHTTLTSPPLSLAGYQSATVSYRRWYTNDTGNSPGLDYWRVAVSGDGGTNWVTLESTTASDRSWSLHSFDLAGLVPFTANMRFRFVAEDLVPGSVVEAGVDEFTLTGYQQSADAQAPVVTLLAPTGGESLPMNGSVPFPVRWRVTDNVGVVRTALVLSRDGGLTWPDTLARGALDSNWAWTPGAPPAATCRLKAVCWDSRHNAGTAASAADFAIVNVTGVGGTPAAALTLLPNRPNPFNPATEIRFVLPRAGRAAVRLYDAAGRLVVTVAAGEFTSGEHAVVWRGIDARGAPVSSGTYLCRLETPSGTLTRKVTLLK